MDNNIRVRLAFATLVQEVSDYLDRFGGFDLNLYDLTDESIKDINRLPLIVELTKAIIRFIKSNYTRNWNSYGYYFWQHAEIMDEQLDLLEPIANEMWNDEELDIDEILSQISTPKVLPDGIDYRKYNDIFEQLKLPSAMFQYIFICENILRRFLIQVLDDNGFPSVDSIGNSTLSNNINVRKTQEANQKYLPMRGGSHDIYYLDFINLNKIIINLWDSCFKDKFERQNWIVERITSLYALRNRVAHNSGDLTTDELKSVESHCREIIKQINPQIR